MSFFGFCLGIRSSNIGEGLIKATDTAAELAWLVAMGCIIMAYIGIGACRELEREYIQEQRDEERRVFERCA